MRKCILFLLIFSTLILLTSCTKSKTDDSIPSESQTLLEIPEETESVPETVIETPKKNIIETEKETLLQTEGEPKDDSYVIRIERDNFPIYDGPSYDNFQVGTIGSAGAFTIVEDTLDSEGFLWGKLKSGAGWVDLSLIEREKNAALSVTASWMDRDVLEGKEYLFCDTDDSPFAAPVAFHTNQTLTNVFLFSIVMNEVFEKGEEYYHIDSWEANTLFVADVYFAGDFTMYGLSFTDSDGAEHLYCATESGRNGSISFIPFEHELIVP